MFDRVLNMRLTGPFNNYLNVVLHTVKQFFAYFKVGLSPSKKLLLFALMKALLKMMKNAFYPMSKALFVFEIFTVLF